MKHNELAILGGPSVKTGGWPATIIKAKNTEFFLLKPCILVYGLLDLIQEMIPLLKDDLQNDLQGWSAQNIAYQLSVAQPP